MRGESETLVLLVRVVEVALLNFLAVLRLEDNYLLGVLPEHFKVHIEGLSHVFIVF